ncbi:MAG: amino acid adenylation domain-containing protein [Tildeniella torsiva UHER 1998/13D]|jgi:amino acid adenylation domain-containing protein/non-ribosomal peptide synthase protein (TIGR01720 family)|nr:amino acid adenylation domain-containing protein [Tildeniella torsiva UHER 1998/13D]
MQQLDRAITGFRLSPQQERLWTLQQQNAVQQVQCVLQIEGELDQRRLKAALQQQVEQHEILRTRFHRRPGMKWPIQVVSSNADFGWTELDWSDQSFTEQQQQLTHLLRVENEVDLAFQPPLQVHLIQCAPAQFWLLIALPALCADPATLSILVNVLFGHDAEAARDPDVIQYVQVSEWQHDLLATEDEDYQAGQAYWNRAALKQSQPVALPFGRSHPRLEQFEPSIFQIQLSQKLRQAIQQLCQSSQAMGIKESHLLLACWQVLVQRLTGEQTAVIGAALDDRSNEEMSSALGPLTTYLPLQGIEPHLSFGQALQQVRDNVETAAQWQDYFIWKNWCSESSLAYFPISFDHTEWSLPRPASHFAVSLDQVLTHVERFQLNLSCHCSPNELILQFQYDSQVLAADAVERLAEQYEVLLGSAIANPDSAISGLEILSPAARHQVLVEFNPTLPAPVQGCLHHRFEAQVAQTPEALAVVCDDQSLSYAQLNQRANQLAHFLQQQGVGVDTPVALYLERSCELMVGLLGIVKAGGAYLPIDPALPSAAIAQRIEHAQTPVILSQASLLDRLPATAAHVLCLDRDWDAIVQYPSDNPCPALRPDNLAYIIYTSGSTGQPKGVAVEHRHLLSYLDGIEQRLNLPPGTSYASVSTVAADMGHTVLFSALCTGGCLHLISTERAANPEALAQYCQQHPIDCLKIVPSHLQALLASAADPAQILPQSCLVLGGEASDWSLIQTIQQLSDCRILNHYGPTEATVGVLAYEIEVIDASGIVPLGRPLAHSQVYVLDEYQQPVPIGVPGELYIGGATVARGYWNQPELTADRFLPNPFRSGRLYRTGDRARYRPEGTLEFLGRLDEQVKLRGYRIELGEIEAVLAQHPAVRQSVVVLREDSPAPKRLVAYVVLNHATQKTEALQEFLAQRLPDYMVPSAVVALEALPLTPNGKLDRQALPVPETLAAQRSYIPPTTPAEKTLAQIWAQVLGLEQVGVDDNFFSLGGDSILSIQVIAKANQAGLSLTPKQLFDHQTIAALAAVAGTQIRVQAEQGVVMGAVPLTPIQQWFWQQAFEQPHHWNQAVLLDCRPSLDPELLQQTVEQLLEHHDGLRSRFVGMESGWQQEVLPPSEYLPVIEVIDLSGIPRVEQDAAMGAQTNRLQGSLDLEAGDLVRVGLFNLGANQPQRLLIVVHHLVIDGVSWRILLEDFQTVYEQLKLGQPVRLPPKTTAFQHWANQLQTYAQSAELLQELTIWQSLLPQAVPHIPLDREGQPNTVASVQTVQVQLSSSETQTLLQAVPIAHKAQINDVLLTALVQAFQPWVGQAEILIDLEGHGREDLFSGLDLSRTVGWFTAVYPVYLTVDASAPELAIQQVKAQLRQIPNHGIGYGLLRYGSDQPASSQPAIAQLQSLPQPQVKFNYLGQFDRGTTGATGLTTSAESYGQTRSPLGHRDRLLEVISYVTDGSLHMEWLYSQNLHDATTIETLAQNFLAALRSLIQQSQEPPAPPTPADFAEFQWSNWNQDDLNDIMAAIGDD